MHQNSSKFTKLGHGNFSEMSIRFAWLQSVCDPLIRLTTLFVYFGAIRSPACY